MSILEKLKQANASEKYYLNPLQPHAISAEDPLFKSNYGILLAAILTAQAQISELQAGLFLMLLESIGVGDQRAAYYEEAQKLDANILVQISRQIREKNFTDNLILDGLVLLSLSEAISDEDIELISEISQLLDISPEKLKFLVNISKIILGLENIEAATSEVLRHWPKTTPKKLTQDQITKGIENGFWIIEHPIEIHSQFSMKNASIIFNKDTKITAVHSRDKISKIENCTMISAQFHFSGGTFESKSSRWLGTYETPCKTLTITNGNSVFDQNNFQTENATAIEMRGGNLSISKSEFIKCGSTNFEAGAILGYYDRLEISECIFSDCSDISKENSLALKLKLGNPCSFIKKSKFLNSNLKYESTGVFYLPFTHPSLEKNTFSNSVIFFEKKHDHNDTKQNLIKQNNFLNISFIDV